MDISIVILTWNSEKYIRKCLDSLISDLYKTNFSYEIYIVDNGSNDRTVSIIQSFKIKYPEHIIPIYLKTNRGTTFSRNIALGKAKGEFIIVMDSDIQLIERTIEPLIELLKKDEKIGILAPQLIYPSGKYQKSTDVFPTIFTKLIRYFFLRPIEKKEATLIRHKKSYEVGYAISAMWIFRRHLLSNVGMLDEQIFYAPEDVDFCLRVWKAGYKVIYTPLVSAIHYTQEISRGFKVNKATFTHIKGLIYYFKKHRYIFKCPEKGVKSGIFKVIN